MEYILEKSYDEFISRHEGINFHFDGQSAELVVLRKNIDDELIEIFNFDKVFFQLFLRDEVVFLLVKFDELKWIDVPFVISKKVTLNPPQRDLGYKINIILASAISGKVYALRDEVLNLGLSKALFWSAYRQMKKPLTNLQEKINKIRAGFSSDEMARLSLGR